jgi:hypothetical protein
MEKGCEGWERHESVWIVAEGVLGVKGGRGSEVNSSDVITKALMVIGSLCPISVEGVIRGLKWDIGPEGGEALSCHHIWTFIPSVRPPVRRAKSGEGGYICMDVLTY